MRVLSAMIWIETRKALRSRMPWFTAAGALVMPLGIAFLIFVATHTELSQKLGLVGAKANLMAYAVWCWSWAGARSSPGQCRGCTRRARTTFHRSAMWSPSWPGRPGCLGRISGGSMPIRNASVLWLLNALTLAGQLPMWLWLLR